MKKTLFLLTVLLSGIVFFANCQPVPAKYGKIDMADLEMKVYDKDTTAIAVILCDYGEFNPNTYDFIRLYRVKILKKEGTDIGPWIFRITGTSVIKGCTYNLVDGEIVESKLKSESIFKEHLREHMFRYRVTMPDVRVGSIVEIQYTFPFLPNEWKFQDNIPVKWSELRITDSPYITFQKVFYGFHPLYIHQSGRWVGKDMPALREEPFMNSLTNYLTKCEIELSNIMVPGYARFFTTSWNAVNDYLLDYQYFGVSMGTAMFLSDDVKSINALNLSGPDKMKAACEIIKRKMKWNEDISLYTSGELGSAYKKGSGNSAEVNLSLVMLLKKLDFESFPVALSTRENGILSPSFPTIDKLNYVIAGVKYNGKNYLFDATEVNLPAGMLPFRALNGRGRIINDKYSDWIELNPEVDKKETVYCELKLSESGELTGSYSCIDYDYAAYYFRNDFKQYNSEDEYIRNIESEYPGLTVNASSYEDIDSLNKPSKEKHEITLSGYADIIGDMISISPMLIDRMETNPFKMDFRKYPVDYGHLTKKRYIVKITIPEGYEISDIPKPAIVQLPDKSARFIFQSSCVGNVFQLTTNFEINKTIFTETEYALLKEFYNLVIAKQAEVIMIKKKA